MAVCVPQNGTRKSSTFGQRHHFVVQHAVFTLTYQAPYAQMMKAYTVGSVTGRVATSADAFVPLQTGEVREKAKF